MNNDEPIKFIFKPTKRALSNFFQPVKKKKSSVREPDTADSISKRYYLIEPTETLSYPKSLKIEFEESVWRERRKSWSDRLFAKENQTMSLEEEELDYIPDSSELDKYEERLDDFSNSHVVVDGLDVDNLHQRDQSNTVDDMLFKTSKSFERSSPVRQIQSKPGASQSEIQKAYTNTSNSVLPLRKSVARPKEIVLIDSDDEDDIQNNSNFRHQTPLKSDIDQPLFDSNYSVGDDLAKQLFGDEIDEISEYEVEKVAPKTIVIDDSSDTEHLENRNDETLSNSESEIENSNDPLLQQLRDQFKPKEKAAKKRVSKASNSKSSSAGQKYSRKPFNKRFGRGGGGRWKKKK